MEKQTAHKDSYKNLIVWNRAVELSIAVYLLTKKFPGEEKYDLVSQMRRAAV
jgi:four helix bundle protein